MQIVITINRENDEVLQRRHSVNNLKEIKELLITIVNIFPESRQKKARTGVQELLMNAVEHGNLKIDGAEKSRIKQAGFHDYENELNKLLGLPDYKETKIQVDYEETNSHISLTISDEGNGFDWIPFMSMSMRDIDENQSYGRGIVMTKMMSFNDIFYNDKGNVVTCLMCK